MKKKRIVDPLTSIAIPSELQVLRAGALKHDEFYLIPTIVQCFIERANQELEDVGPYLYAKAHTIARTVSIFYMQEFVMGVAYEAIEDDIVGALDRMAERLKEDGYGRKDPRKG